MPLKQLTASSLLNSVRHRSLIATCLLTFLLLNPVSGQTRSSYDAARFQMDLNSIVAKACEEKKEVEDRFARDAATRKERLLTDLRGRVIHWVEAANADEAKKTLLGLQEYKAFTASLVRNSQEIPSFKSNQTQEYATDIQTLRGKTATAIQAIERKFQKETEELKRNALRELGKEKILAQQNVEQSTLMAVDSEIRKIQGISFSFRGGFIDQVKADLDRQNDGFPPLAVAPFDTAQAKAHQQAWAEHLGVPVEFTNRLGMKFVLIPPGTFMMGKNGSQHKVTLSKPFYIGKYEVTQAQYKGVIGTNPSKYPGILNPVENVYRKDAVTFCDRLSQSVSRHFKKSRYALPTEAQWEYACRAGSQQQYFFGDNHLNLGDFAWYAANANRKTHPVGQKKSNPWGLYDILGNVEEFCQDWSGAYPDQHVTDPLGNQKGQMIGPKVSLAMAFQSSLCYVGRGGRFNSGGNMCTSFQRAGNYPNTKHDCVGFRVAINFVNDEKTSR